MLVHNPLPHYQYCHGLNITLEPRETVEPEASLKKKVRACPDCKCTVIDK